MNVTASAHGSVDFFGRTLGDFVLGSRIGEGSAVSTAMVPFLLAAIMFSWFGLQRRKWQQGEDND